MWWIVKRAIRRHHRERLINKMVKQNYYGLADSVDKEFYNGVYTDHDRMLNYKKSYNNRQVCSCWQCGNPRKQNIGDKNKLSFQEIRMNDKTKNQLEEIGIV